MKILNKKVHGATITIDNTNLTIDVESITIDADYVMSLLFTADTTFLRCDSDLITADIRNYDDADYHMSLIPRQPITSNNIRIEVIREITNKLIQVKHTWNYIKNVLTIGFTSEDINEDEKYSITIYQDDVLIYRGKAICTSQYPQDYKYTQIKKKLYL